MAQRPTADYPIDANTTSGTDLSLILNRFQTALESGNSGSSRPAYITAGGLWVKEGDPMELYLYDGTTDQLLYDTSNGINVTEGLWTLVDENNEAGEIQRPSDVLIDGNLTVTGDLVDGNGDPISIIDPATEDGVIATWDNTAEKWTPEGGVVVSGGNVGIGTNVTANANLTINDSAGSKVRLTDNATINLDLGVTPSTECYINALNSMPLVFKTGGSATERMRIDAAGDATFSGSVSAGGSYGTTTLANAGNIEIKRKQFPAIHLWETDTSSTNEAVFAFNSDTIQIRRNTDTFLSFLPTGDATFSGAVNAGQSKVWDAGIYRVGWNGLSFNGTGVLPCNGSGQTGVGNADGVYDLGLSGDRFKNCYLTGSVVSTRHGISVGTRDIIETLHTLREATKDESTLEGLRDAIGDAIGGLIQKFEAIQAEAKEKLEEAYNQTGTQEITPDKGTKDDKPEAGTLDLEE